MAGYLKNLEEFSEHLRQKPNTQQNIQMLRIVEKGPLGYLFACIKDHSYGKAVYMPEM